MCQHNIFPFVAEHENASRDEFARVRSLLRWGGGQGRTFFMMPALRFEKVMCRLDLSWMNLISIFRRSRPGLSSSSSSSSATALGRGRFTPRLASAAAAEAAVGVTAGMAPLLALEDEAAAAAAARTASSWAEEGEGR